MQDNKFASGLWKIKTPAERVVHDRAERDNGENSYL
jgi:hypothetical protein